MKEITKNDFILRFEKGLLKDSQYNDGDLAYLVFRIKNKNKVYLITLTGLGCFFEPGSRPTLKEIIQKINKIFITKKVLVIKKSEILNLEQYYFT